MSSVRCIAARRHREHWEGVYRANAADHISWFQRDPDVSLRLVAAAPGSIVDAGAGAAFHFLTVAAQQRVYVRNRDALGGPRRRGRPGLLR
jgi:hypothetical protein